MTSTLQEGYFVLPTLDVNILSGHCVSRSIMEQMIASWSMVMVHALMAAGPVLEPNERDRGVACVGSRAAEHTEQALPM